ncbi:MAG: LysM peptidoglycan-binding domain-containing protein [Xanthomonadaceae bacterium]|nr:LysM peptidoglycan-binding domain-containing protein [Xanthomonadaceae bacterium]
MELKKFMLIVAMAFGVSAGTVGEGTVNVQTLTAHYTVKSGDTLTNIAHTLFGRASAWKDIETTNKMVIKNPNFITPGMVLTYSVKAAQQSMAKVLRAKELRKLAGKQTAVRTLKTSLKTQKHFQQVKYNQAFGPSPVSVVKVQKIKPMQSASGRTPARVKNHQTLIRMTGFKNLEI